MGVNDRYILPPVVKAMTFLPVYANIIDRYCSFLLVKGVLQQEDGVTNVVAVARIRRGDTAAE